MHTGDMDLKRRIEAHDELLFHGEAHTGWAAAQHDTGSRDVVSLLKSEADRLAEEMRLRRSSHERWDCPATWCDGETVLFTCEGHIVCDAKQQVQRQFCWGSKSQVDDVESRLPVAGALQHEPDRQLLRTWDKMSPYCPEDAAAAQMSATYEDLTPFLVDEEHGGQCPRCGMACRVPSYAPHAQMPCANGTVGKRDGGDRKGDQDTDAAWHGVEAHVDGPHHRCNNRESAHPMGQAMEATSHAGGHMAHVFG